MRNWTRKIRAGAVVCLVVGTLLGGVGAEASASGRTALVGPRQDLSSAHVEIRQANGNSAVAPCKQSGRRIECLTEDGVGLVGALNLGGSYRDGTIDTGGSIEPLSAYRTRGRVTIDVRGSGLRVDSWETYAVQYAYDGCVAPHDAYFWAKPPWGDHYGFVTAYLYYGSCYQVPWPYNSVTWMTYGDDGQAGTYVNQTKLMNAWEPSWILAGQPTVTVHD